MAVLMKVNLGGLEGVSGQFKRMLGRGKDLRPAFKAAGVLAMESVNRNFMEGGRPEAWRALAPATVRLRAGSGNPETLRDSGVLMTSIGNSSGGGYMELKPLSVRVGTNVPYAKYHDQPDGENTGSIPQRKFMLLQPEDEEKITKIFEDHLTKGTEA